MNTVNKDSDEYILSEDIGEGARSAMKDFQTMLLKFYSLEYDRFLIDLTKEDQIGKYLYGIWVNGVKELCGHLNGLKLSKGNPIFRKLDEDGEIKCMRLIKTYDTKNSIKLFKDEYKELVYDIKYVVDEQILTNIINEGEGGHNATSIERS